MNQGTWLAGCIVRAVALSVGLGLAAGTASGDDREPLPVDQLKAFGEIFDLVKEQYIHPVDDRELLEDAIRGMVSGLDPHSAYLTAEEHRELQEGTSGEFGGLGIEITAEDGLIRIITPLDDSPAYDAGLLPGDLVTRVDGESVRDLTATEGREADPGPAGHRGHPHDPERGRGRAARVHHRPGHRRDRERQVRARRAGLRAHPRLEVPDPDRSAPARGDPARRGGERGSAGGRGPRPSQQPGGNPVRGGLRRRRLPRRRAHRLHRGTRPRLARGVLREAVRLPERSAHRRPRERRVRFGGRDRRRRPPGPAARGDRGHPHVRQRGPSRPSSAWTTARR